MKKKYGRRKEIISILIKHGFREGVKIEKAPEKLRLVLEELGPTFIKIGQILSLRTDIIPKEYIFELEKLQNNANYIDFIEIKDILEENLNKDINLIFDFFDENPLASASLSQVHKAILKNKDIVIVKVQRPMVEEKMTEDIKILKSIARITKFLPIGHVINPVEFLEEVWQSAKKELNFLEEARNIEVFRENNKDVKYVYVPKVYESLSTEKILIMEYIEGEKINNLSYMKENKLSPEDVVKKMTNNYLKQVFNDGFFHADPHPGNIFLYNKKICFIDFGMVGTIDENNRKKFNEFLFAVAIKDIEAISTSVLKIGIKKGKVNKDNLHTGIAEIYEEYLDIPLNEVDVTKLLNNILEVCYKNNIAFPKSISLILKGFITIEGIIENIAPQTNIMDIVIPYTEKQIIKSFDIKKEFMEYFQTIYKLLKYSPRLPIQLYEIMEKALKGQLKVNFEVKQLNENVNEIRKMLNRLVVAIITGSLIIGSSIVATSKSGPMAYGVSLIGIIGYIVAGIMGLYLIISIFRSGKM